MVNKGRMVPLAEYSRDMLRALRAETGSRGIEMLLSLPFEDIVAKHTRDHGKK